MKLYIYKIIQMYKPIPIWKGWYKAFEIIKALHEYLSYWHWKFDTICFSFQCGRFYEVRHTGVSTRLKHVMNPQNINQA